MNGHLYNAYQCIWEDPRTGEYRVQPGEVSIFQQKLFSTVRDLGLDKDHHKITDRGIYRKFRDGLIEIAEVHGTDLTEEGLTEQFHEKKGDILSDWLGEPPNTYTIVLPLMIRSKNLPEEIELYKSKAEQIDNSQWDHFLSTARAADDSNFDAFIDELPNDYSDNPLSRREWTYLKVEFDARDEFYALLKVEDLIEVRLAEINFFVQLWGGMPQPARSDRPSYEKWSRLQEPPFYLVFEDSDFLTYRGDYDYRRSIGILHFDHVDDVDEISDIPSFNYDAGKDTFEGCVVSALLAYQDGITERSVRQSFFSFWRGIEILSNTGNYSNANDFKEMVDRGEFAISYHNGGDSFFRQETKRAVDEIEERRHELVHEGLKTEVHQGHREGAKLLLDGLLLLYIDKYGDWDLDDMESFLKHGVEYQDKIRFFTTLLRDLSKP